MAQIELVEILAVTADPAILSDADKYLLTINYNGNQYRVAVPFQPINSLADLKTVLTLASQKAKKRQRAVNLTDRLKGVYTI